MRTRQFRTAVLALSAALFASTSLAFAEFDVVSGPSSDPKCFVPWNDQTIYLKYPRKDGPYRIAFVNGFVANTFRIQMIQSAKAFAALPDVAPKLKEFKVISTGDDVPAQISAVDNFIDSGFDAIVVNAQNPTAFGPVIKRAKKAGVVLVAVDNILETKDAINVSVDEAGLAEIWSQWVIDHLPNAGKILEVRGIPGTSVDTLRHEKIQAMFKATGKDYQITEINGRWDSAAAQKAAADAIATNGPFDGVVAQGGDPGVVRALIDAKHPFVPYGGEEENGFRKLCARYSGDGLKCASAGTGPGQVAVALKVALSALAGNVVPQKIRLPIARVSDPSFKDAENYYSAMPEDFTPGNSFPTCGIDFTPQELSKHSKENQ